MMALEQQQQLLGRQQPAVASAVQLQHTLVDVPLPVSDDFFASGHRTLGPMPHLPVILCNAQHCTEQ